MVGRRIMLRQMKRTKVGIVGFGSLGQYLTKAILTDSRLSSKFELCFVWNRTVSAIRDVAADVEIPAELILENLDEFVSRRADLIVEVAHPFITMRYAEAFLQHADYFVGSPTAFANSDLELRVRLAAGKPNGHGVYVPCGALWGAVDIARMADAGTLKALCITMKKHPVSLKVADSLQAKMIDMPDDRELVVFEGSVRELCPLAPNNVNTMAAAAMAAHSLGFDGVRARLVADKRLDSHIVEIDVLGPETPGLGRFELKTTRTNPAPPGVVTGAATYASFVSSLLNCGGRGDGVHFC